MRPNPKLMALISLFAMIASFTSAATCNSEVGKIEIIQNVEKAQADLLDGNISRYIFDSFHGEESSNAVITGNYDNYLDSIGCGLDGTNLPIKKHTVELKRVIIERDALIELCINNIEKPMHIDPKGSVLVALNDMVLIYTDETCGIWAYK